MIEDVCKLNLMIGLKKLVGTSRKLEDVTELSMKKMLEYKINNHINVLQ